MWFGCIVMWSAGEHTVTVMHICGGGGVSTQAAESEQNDSLMYNLTRGLATEFLPTSPS